MGKYLFDVAVVNLKESDVDMPPQDGTVIMGWGRSAPMELWVAGCANGTKIFWFFLQFSYVFCIFRLSLSLYISIYL